MVASTVAEAFGQKLSPYLEKKQVQSVLQAYEFAKQCHEGQNRQSGEPYITHPLAVASILADMHLDHEGLMAALLHDVLEDTHVNKKELKRLFGKTVADLVDGVSKLDEIETTSRAERQADSFQKMTLAMSKDVRVMLIKLADRLHNMRTIKGLIPEKRRRIARETLEIYAPIAQRLGINNIRVEFEELGFSSLYPVRHQRMMEALKTARGPRREIVQEIKNSIDVRLNKESIRAEVTGREKHLWSIYQKMKAKKKSFRDIMDVFAFRIVVDSVDECYRTLGIIHNLFKPVPGEFKDYIAIPKVNGYQSLHNILVGMHGVLIEIQIRTQDMDAMANYGIAAHWLYKSQEEGNPRAYRWIQGLLEIQKQAGDSLEFIEHVKADLFPDEVYVFTAQGEIVSLPQGATPVDFAYAVHTGLGDTCVACKTNGQLTPLSERLESGVRIEIITAKGAQPNPSWLNFIITGKARSQIRSYLRTAESKDLVILGDNMLNNALKAFHIDPDVIKKKYWSKLILDYHLKTKEDVLIEIALGKKINVMVAHQLTNIMDGVKKTKTQSKFLDVITIKGSEDMAVELANCCHPIPGDPILGYINKGRGLIIHTHDCPIIRKFNLDPERWVDVEWEPNSDQLYKVSLNIFVSNERGMLAKIASAISDASSNIENVNLSETDGSNFVNMNFIVQVKNRIHLAEIIRSVRKIKRISRITRVKTVK